MLHRLARSLARKYEFAYHEPLGEFDTVALEGAWKAACTFRQIGPAGWITDAADMRVDGHGVPVGLYSWGHLKIKGAIIESARSEMSQHGCGRSLGSRFETLSLDMPWANDGERTFGETLVLEDQASTARLEQVEDHAWLLALRERLEPKEWDILLRRADGQSMRSIGEDVYGVSESRISQMLSSKIVPKARRILEALAADGDPINPLTPLQREECAENTWLAVLAAGEASEEQRLEKVRARYADRQQEPVA